MKEIQLIVSALAPPEAAEWVLATLVTAEGSSYRRPGARLLIGRDGRRIGSISGGCLEEDVIARATRVFATGKAEAIVYDTTSENDLVWGVGLGCHGIVRVLIEKLGRRPSWVTALSNSFAARRSVELAVVHAVPDPDLIGTHLASELAIRQPAPDTGVFFETVMPPTALIVFGAGDDAVPLVRLAKELGWHVTIADPRASFATASRFPFADTLVVGPADELVARTAPREDSLVVVMTHHYVHDVPLLRHLLPLTPAYLGLLGPRKRADKILADLAQIGFDVTPSQRARLHAPVGLDIGADAPEQVALSMIAEMHAVLSGRNARPLRERQKPIHS